MRMRRIRFAVLVASSLLLSVPAAQSAQRTFVSTSGNDANACSLAAPCRAFAAAILMTDPGGEIVVLDSGGYGAVTVNKNVSIVSPSGVYAGISVFGGQDGVTVAAPAGNVVLRGLAINGQGGNVGIRVQAGDVHVENCVISNIGGVGAAGILIEGGTSVRVSGTVVRSSTEGMRVLPAGSVTVLIRDSEFSHLGQVGIRVSPSGAGNNALVTVERTSVTRSSGYGIYSGPTGGGTATVVVTQSVLSEHAVAGVASEAGGAVVWVRESAVTRNGIGLKQLGAGVLNACGANLLAANTTATSGTLNTTSCLDVSSGTGTVTSVATGAGLTGGPITTTGTIAADTAYLQRRVTGTCTSGSSIRTVNTDGTVVCEPDDVGSGTVTQIGTGTGLTGGPITAAGTVSVAAGGIGNAQLASGAVNVAKLDTTSTDARYFKQGGNALGASASLGTNDNQTLALRANGLTSLKLEPTTADPVNFFGTATPSVIGGWEVNAAFVGVIGATIGGGGGDFHGNAKFNRVTDHYGTIGGGMGNEAGDAIGTTEGAAFATVAGGYGNTASGRYGAVGGGELNVASGSSASVGGGQTNVASASGSTVGGGHGNGASGMNATVGGGFAGTASGTSSTVAGGAQGTASGVGSTIGGGGSASCGVGCTASYPNVASGDASTVPGGGNNVAGGAFSIASGFDTEAGGDYSVAMGRRAKALGNGSFSFADSSNFDFSAGSVNAFRVRATGGVRFVTDIDGTGATTWSCLAVAGASWACASDRNLKHSLVELDGRVVLAKLAAMPLYQWQPKGRNAHVRHYGPMAQDFYAAFGLGDDDTMIGMQDADGVALAAIQGLNAKLEMKVNEQAQEIAALRDRLALLESLRGELAAIKETLSAGTSFAAAPR